MVNELCDENPLILQYHLITIQLSQKPLRFIYPRNRWRELRG